MLAQLRQSFKDRIDRVDLVLTVALAASLAVHLWSLMRFPAPFVDEAWNISRAWGYLQTGRVFGALDAGVFERFDGYWTIFPFPYHLILSLSLRLFGAPNLLAGRLVSLAFGLILLGAVYLIGEHAGGKRLGLVGTLLISLSWPFLYSAHLARSDILTSAFGFTATAIHLRNERQSFWASGLSGLLIGAAFETHPNAMIYGPAIAALHFGQWRWAMFRKRVFWGFVCGTIIGLMFYLALHVLPYPQTYFAVQGLGLNVNYTPPILTLGPRIIAQGIGDEGFMLFAVYQPMLAVILVSGVVLVKRRAEGDKKLLLLALVLTLSHALLIRNKFLYYAILVTPGLDIMVAAFLLEFVRWPWRGRAADYIRHMLVWGLCIGSIALNFSLFNADFGDDYRLTQSEINRVVQPGDSIIGPQTYWFGLYDHTYYSWEQLIYFQRYAPGSTLEDAMDEFRPDVFVIDRFVEWFIADPTQTTGSYLQRLLLPRGEMDDFLRRRAVVITEFESDYYGRVRVYRIRWDAP